MIKNKSKLAKHLSDNLEKQFGSLEGRDYSKVMLDSLVKWEEMEEMNRMRPR
jgi:hypothetical protein